MSVTGVALVLFLTFHGLMNAVALFSANGYNWICEMLGTNWYALVGTAGLAVLVAVHFVYAFILTLQNRKARGNNRYAVVDKPEKVEWASQNMLVIGLIVVIGLLLHLYNFWAHMMFGELFIDESPLRTDGYYWICMTFHGNTVPGSAPTVCGIIYTVIYLIWFALIWMHLNHGIWSAMQTMGWSGKTWLKRWQCIGKIVSTCIIALFVAVALKFCIFGSSYKFIPASEVQKCEMSSCPMQENCSQKACDECCQGACDECCQAGQCGQCPEQVPGAVAPEAEVEPTTEVAPAGE